MKAFILFLKRQKTHIQVGGWPAFEHKIRILPARVGKRISILYGFYFVFALVRYLAKTLMRRHSAVHLRRFGAEFSDLIQERLAYQSDAVNNLLIEADKRYRNADINGMLPLCQEAVSIDPRRPEIYSYAANPLMLQGKSREAIAATATGMRLLHEQAIEQKLDLFGVKIIGMEWSSIGHESLLDPLVKLSILGLLSPQKRVVFMRSESVANLCYLNYWRRYLDIVFVDNRKYRFLESFFSPIFENLSMFQLKEGFVHLCSAWNLAENLWRSEKRPPLLELNEDDRKKGQKILEQWSIPSHSWFVCMHVREGYKWDPRGGPNSDILTYLPAIKAITSRGGWVIRMGDPGIKPLPPLPKVIDYANTEYKSDWMDVFLWASCKFFIGTSSGPSSVPPTFGVPVLSTNACAIGEKPNFHNSLMLPKLFWSREKKRFFTFQEMLDGPTGWTVSRVFDGIDCDLIDNTPEEIESAVIEMLDNLENSPGKYNNLSDLQKRFNSLQMQYGDSGQMTIAETFAQRHRDLF